MLRRVSGFFVDRLGLAPVVDYVARHAVPPETRSWRAWAYVLGSATLAAFLLQVLTGIALATRYVPAPAYAYDSLIHITRDAWLGSFLRSAHYVGASAMVVLIGLHMARVFLTGSYKYPREMNWVMGVVLLVLTMAMALTGQLLRWDQDGLWTVSVASYFVGRVPLVGSQLAQFILAGDAVGGATLSRFFVFHVIILPLAIVGVVTVHLYLVLHHGISEMPRAGRPVTRTGYRTWYRRHADQGGHRYWPDAAWREVVAGSVVILLVIVLAIFVDPKGPGLPPDPTMVNADPQPDWFVRWYYALLWIKPRGLESFVMVYLPLLIGGGLLALPFVAGTGERSLRQRPWALPIVFAIVTALGVLTELGMRAPWSMEFDTQPFASQELALPDSLAREGALVFHERGCQFCHSAFDRGGGYGPDLTDIHRRMPSGMFVTTTLNGTGDMPAYRGKITQEELSAILAFLTHRAADR